MFNSCRTISSFLGGGAVVDHGAHTLCGEQRGREAKDCKDPDLGSGSTSACTASSTHTTIFSWCQGGTRADGMSDRSTPLKR